MKKLYFKGIFVVVTIIFHAVIAFSQPSTTQNFFVTNTVKQAGITTQTAVDNLPISTQGKSQVIAYFDGLGRSLQNVTTKASASQNDLVVGVEFDQYGREVKKYLPYADNTAPGGYKSGWKTLQASSYNGQIPNVTPDASPFSEAILEPSPLSRIFAQGAPGDASQPNPSDPYDASSKTSQYNYLFNETADNVRIMSMDAAGNYSSPGYYSVGQLTKKIKSDEQQQFVVEFFDKAGRIICKRVLIDNDVLQTYFIYDDLGLLRAIIQPEGVAALQTNGWIFPSNFSSTWMFLYRYDERARMVMKKIPGADSVVMIYDKWDRVVLTQDGNLRASHTYSFTKFDPLDRPAVTGQITDSRSLSDVRSDVAAATGRFESVNTSVNEGYTLNNSFPSSSNYTLSVFTIEHYDDYNNLPSWKAGYTFVNEDGVSDHNVYLLGKVIATQSRILGTNNFVRTVTYFDDKYRVIQVTSDNAAGGLDRTTKVLSFDGKVSSDFHNHTSRFFTTPIQVEQDYEYDHMDRLLSITHKIGNQEAVTISENAFNEIGQPLSKKLHQSPSHPNYLQKLDYSYNIRGWLNSINKPYADATGYEEDDLFNLELHYNITNMSGLFGSRAQFNGNISEQIWKSGYDEYLRGYQYLYDKANRLDTSTYGFKYFNGWGPTWGFTEKYDESTIVYDRNGNLLSMMRYHGDWNRINWLNYLNYDGNKLGRVEDWVGPLIPFGFQDHEDGSGVDYTYDANGNTLTDFNKGISSTTYNYLNLPTHVNVKDPVTMTDKGTVDYIYDAAGNKLQKTVTNKTISPNIVTNYFYAGDFVYRNDTLEYILHPEGRLRPQSVDVNQPLSISNLKYVYDYFMKDHLGSVRAVLSTEQETDLYAATMEVANATKENQLFTNVSSTQNPKVGGFDSDASNAKISKLHGNTSTNPSMRVGPAIVIKVMAGDTISVSTYTWYSGSTQAPPSGLAPIIDDVLPILTNGTLASGATHSGSIPSGDISSMLNDVVSSFLDGPQSSVYDNSRPKAFLNWIIVDEEFKGVESPNHMGAAQVPLISGAMEKQQLPGPSNMVVRRNGYLYIYLSNESDQFVYFDDLVINHKRGPLTEQKDYYAFGSEIPGLSTKAFKPNYFANQDKYTGQLLDDDFNLGMYKFKYRNYDPQIARFAELDPLADKYPYNSTFAYAENRPISGIDLEGLEYLRAGESLIKMTLEFPYRGTQVSSATVFLNQENLAPATKYYVQTNNAGCENCLSNGTSILASIVPGKPANTADGAEMDEVKDQPKALTQPDIDILRVPNNKKEASQILNSGQFFKTIASSSAKADLLMLSLEVGKQFTMLYVNSVINDDINTAKEQAPKALEVVNDINLALKNNLIVPSLQNSWGLGDLANYLLNGNIPTDNNGKEDHSKLEQFKQIQAQIAKLKIN